MTPHLASGSKLKDACAFVLWFVIFSETRGYLVVLSPADFNNDNANVWNEFDDLNNNNVDNNNVVRPDSY